MHSSKIPFEQFCSDMVSLSKPLNQIGIDYLSFTRIYANGDRINLSSNPLVLQEHFTKKQYNTVGNERPPAHYEQNQVIVWSSLPYQEIYHNAKQMGIGHGIYLVALQNEEYSDSFGFATSVLNETILNSYFNNLELLKKFTQYFYEHELNVLNSAQKQKIRLPFSRLDTQFVTASDPLRSFLQKKVMSISITPRQSQCVDLLMQGLTYKEIGKKMCLSPRTIECYIDQLKLKLNCRSKAALILKINEFLV